MALLLERHGLSAWFGALYGLYPGLFVAVSRDLAEPLAYALAAFGLLAADRRRLPQELELVPFAGLAGQWPWSTLTLEQIYAVVVPALLCAALAAAARAPRPALVALAANVIVLVVLLPEPSYDDYAASGRIALGVVLAFLLCLPAVHARGRVTQSWIVVVLLFAPWYALLPAAFER